MTQFAAEITKTRTTRTLLAIIASLLGVVTLAAVVHVVTFDAELIDSADEQRRVLLDIGVNLGIVFAGITGALAITSEFRFGTIRQTLLKQPDRAMLITMKALVQLLVGVVIGGLATAYATALTAVFLDARDLDFALTSTDTARLVGGGAISGLAFAVIGVGIGAVARQQVPVIVGMLVWLLFLDNLLRAGAPGFARFTPASLGRAAAGDGPASLDSPILAVALLCVVALVAIFIGRAAITRRDIA
jgi:ABC-2 type transport system permease protein